MLLENGNDAYAAKILKEMHDDGATRLLLDRFTSAKNSEIRQHEQFVPNFPDNPASRLIVGARCRRTRPS